MEVIYMLFLLAGFAYGESLLACRYSCHKPYSGLFVDMQFVMYIRYIRGYVPALHPARNINIRNYFDKNWYDAERNNSRSRQVLPQPALRTCHRQIIINQPMSWHMVILAADGSVYAHGVSSRSQRKNT